ncbi:MAG: polyribonucleotide nucleotidyltransferase [Verrucomicrobiota bacterium]|nr:polyribonucleotide nucleotidyltransferase [Verrucomicrobiota bacterium]MEE2724827.1 polyribonucleotide nucleotidyltransferase [Verrucomicrobiota bacterium]
MSTENTSITLDGKEIIIETGKMGRLADGACTVTCGETTVMVTAVSQTKMREGQNWFPLSVEYKEKAAAAGRFPGGYFKREGRPTEKEILTCRMTDRPLRPLFPKGYLYDTQIVALLLSADGENDSDVLSMVGASCALCLSDIPFAGPIGAVRVGYIDEKFVVNPTHTEMENSVLDLVYAGNETEVVMIEGAAEELPEDIFCQALEFAQGHVTKLVQVQKELAEKVGKPKRNAPLLEVKDEMLEIAYSVAGEKIEDAIYKPSKIERGKAVDELREEVTNAILEKYEDATEFAIDQAFDFMQKKAFRKTILEKGVRADGRQIDELRPLSAEANLMPRSHGSALFARGETQALGLCTLAPADEAQYIDAYTGGEEEKSFLLHYHFPPFSVGETGRMGGLNRREIGHGALAERSIKPALPSQDDFPYAIRVTSEVMESNGSTSMASVCAGTMALLDAGVPLKRPVAGISVGLVTEMDDSGKIKEYKRLLDIIGSEDFFGDMDFKLCGTETGVTGFQLDLKLTGLPIEILKEAIHQAAEAREKVLAVMAEGIAGPAEISPHAPRIESIKINPEKIGNVIGPGGKIIKGIQAETGAEINIEDDGTVRIYAIKKESLDRALEMVNNITAEIEIDKIYQGKVVSTTNFGAFMEVLPGQDGMIHISELADFRVEQVEDVVNVGDVIYAKCIGIDDKGRVKMSRQAALEERGEQHIDDALREKAQAKREERSKRSNDEDWSPSDGDKKNRRRNNRRRGGDNRRGDSD